MGLSTIWQNVRTYVLLIRHLVLTLIFVIIYFLSSNQFGPKILGLGTILLLMLFTDFLDRILDLGTTLLLTLVTDFLVNKVCIVAEGQYGVPRPWYFPLQKSYWFEVTNKRTVEVNSSGNEQDSHLATGGGAVSYRSWVSDIDSNLSRRTPAQDKLLYKLDMVCWSQMNFKSRTPNDHTTRGLGNKFIESDLTAAH